MPTSLACVTAIPRIKTITQIETLVSGGTRVVLQNADDAAVIGRAYRKEIIDGAVTRTPSRTLHY